MNLIKFFGGTVLMGTVLYGVFSFVSSSSAASECQQQAFRWAGWAADTRNLRDPSQRVFYAGELAKARVACPQGHTLIQENSIPDEVKLLASDPGIIEKAKKSMEQEKMRSQEKA